MAMVQQQRANFNAKDLVSPIDPTITGSAAVERAANAYAKGALTTEEILKSVGPAAHEQAQLESLVRQRAKEDLENPAAATGRKAIALQQEQLVQRAVNAGAQLPRNQEGGVDFDQLFAMAPQITQYEQAEANRQNRLEEWQTEYLRYAKGDPTKPRDFYLSWRGNQPVPADQFMQEGRNLRVPKTFSEMFSQGATQAGQGAAQGIQPAPAGEIVGQPIRDPGPVNMDGTPVQPVQPQAPMATQPSAGGTAPGAGGMGQGMQTGAGQPAPGYFGQQGWKQVGVSQSGNPIYADAQGNDRVPTEAEQKAFMAENRQQVEKVIEKIEDLGLTEGGFDITGKGEGFRKWVANVLPDWTPFMGRESLAAEQKLFDAAASGWIQGLLRLESGAAISVAEERSYRNTFLPQTGDDRSTVELKRQMRRGMADSIAQLAGRIDEMNKAGTLTPEAQAEASLIAKNIRLNYMSDAASRLGTQDAFDGLEILQQQIEKESGGQYTAGGLPANESGKRWGMTANDVEPIQ